MDLVDTHAHLDFADELGGWLGRAKADGVEKIICVGTSVEASRKCVEIAEKYSDKDSGQARMTGIGKMQVYATVGIHAEDGKGDIEKYGSLEKCIDELRMIARDSIASLQNDKVGGKNDKVIVGVGECGFDFKLDGDKRKVISDKEKDFQKELFEAQIGLAVELGLPLIIHCRNAWENTFQLLDSIAKRVSLQNDKREGLHGVFHSWTGDWEAAQKALDMGFYISFSGIVTFKNAPKVQEVASKMPINKMLLETDSPFLTPEPVRSEYYRKKGSNPTSLSNGELRGAHMRNEPKNVKIVGKFIADLRHQPFELISDTTSANATKLFGL